MYVSQQVEGSCREDCEEVDITSLGPRTDQDNSSDLGPCGEHRVGGEWAESVPCRRSLEGRGSRNRHARVVDGRLIFDTAGSVNGDTCPVNPPPPTCTLDSTCLVVS